MTDLKKTRATLLKELNHLRSRIRELEKSERGLKESGGVYQNIFNLAPHLASITRLQDGRYPRSTKRLAE